MQIKSSHILEESCGGNSGSRKSGDVCGDAGV